MLERPLELTWASVQYCGIFDKNEPVMKVSGRRYCWINKATVAVGLRYGLPRASVG